MQLRALTQMEIIPLSTDKTGLAGNARGHQYFALASHTSQGRTRPQLEERDLEQTVQEHWKYEARHVLRLCGRQRLLDETRC